MTTDEGGLSDDVQVVLNPEPEPEPELEPGDAEQEA